MQLSALQSENRRFTVLALDTGVRLIEKFDLPATAPETDETIKQVLSAFQQVLAPHVSAITIDPMYGFQLSRTKPTTAGLLFRLEKPTTQVDPLALPILIGNWGVGAVRQNYGAAKLELWYHPKEAAALEKKQLVAELYDYCQHEGIALLLKLIVYTPADETFTVASFQTAQLEAAHEFAASCSLMALQYPQDALAAATLTAELDVPWLLCSDDVEYEAFKDILRTSIDNGASGYVVDEVLWREIFALQTADKAPDWPAITKFLQTTARDRAIELARIVAETEPELE